MTLAMTVNQLQMIIISKEKTVEILKIPDDLEDVETAKALGVVSRN